MAGGQIQPGDSLSYTVYDPSYDGSKASNTDFNTLRQCMESAINSSGVASVSNSRAGDAAASFTLRSPMERANVADLKGNIDGLLGQCGFAWGLGSTLVNDSAQGRPAGSGAPQTNIPPPPKPQADFLAQMAASMGIPKDTLIFGLAGVALLLFLKKR